MARGVNDVDLDSVVVDGSVFGEDRDSTLALDIVGVHDPLGYFLIFAEDTALF